MEAVRGWVSIFSGNAWNGINKISPDFSLNIKQFSMTLQDDYSSSESTKIEMFTDNY